MTTFQNKHGSFLKAESRCVGMAYSLTQAGWSTFYNKKITTETISKYVYLF